MNDSFPTHRDRVGIDFLSKRLIWPAKEARGLPLGLD